MNRTEAYRGFDDQYLVSFAAQQQAMADELQRQAARAQSCAAIARREIERRKQQGDAHAPSSDAG